MAEFPIDGSSRLSNTSSNPQLESVPLNLEIRCRDTTAAEARFDATRNLADSCSLKKSTLARNMTTLCHTFEISSKLSAILTVLNWMRAGRTIKPRQPSSTLHPLCSVAGLQGESSASGEELQENRGKMIRERIEVMMAPSEKLYGTNPYVSLYRLLSESHSHTRLIEPSRGNDLFSEYSRETCSMKVNESIKALTFQLESQCKTYRVPSVGIDPPTPVPRKKSARQRVGKLGANADAIPKTAVNNRVKLNAGNLPLASLYVPQTKAPTMHPLKMLVERSPIHRSEMSKSFCTRGRMTATPCRYMLSAAHPSPHNTRR